MRFLQSLKKRLHPANQCVSVILGEGFNGDTTLQQRGSRQIQRPEACVLQITKNSFKPLMVAVRRLDNSAGAAGMAIPYRLPLNLVIGLIVMWSANQATQPFTTAAKTVGRLWVFRRRAARPWPPRN